MCSLMWKFMKKVIEHRKWVFEIDLFYKRNMTEHCKICMIFLFHRELLENDHLIFVD